MTSPLNILYVSQYFPPEACAPAARVDEFSREWAQAGHRIQVLTGFPNHPEGVLHPEYKRRWWKGLAREERQGVKVTRTWLYPAANRGLWGRAATYASFAFSAALVGPRITPRGGVVVATSPQLLVGLAGWIAARLGGARYVFEVRDLWPQSLEAVGQTSRHSLLYRVLDRIASFLYRHADHVVVDGEAKRRVLITRGVPPGKLSVVRNGVAEDFALDPDSDVFRRERARIRGELGLTDQFVVMYAGTLGMAHGLGTVLDAADRLLEHREVTFVLIGTGAEQAVLVARNRPVGAARPELGYSNVRFLGKLPHPAIPAYLAAADLCLVPLRRSEVFKTAIPSKMFEAMAAAKPVILGVEGEAREILEQARAGLAIPPEDTEALAAAILRLRQDATLARELGANGRRAALETYSRSKQARVYLGLLDALVSGPVNAPVDAEPRQERMSNT
jgi:putative colanic acid biosynthesis glycosyltransferase WcaI